MDVNFAKSNGDMSSKEKLIKKLLGKKKGTISTADIKDIVIQLAQDAGYLPKDLQD